MNEAEPRNNGYDFLQGKSLLEPELTLQRMDVDEEYFVDIKNIITNYIDH
jgi:hypothetical protein